MDGVSAHNKLSRFFSKTRKHHGFMDLVSACDAWAWVTGNNPTKTIRKRQRMGDNEENDDKPSFLEFFTQMMGVW